MEAAHIVLSGAWLQDVDTFTSTDTKWLMIFVGIVAIAMATQAIVVVIAAVGAIKVRKRLLAIAEETRLKLLPVIDTTHNVVHDLAPKLKVISENLVETSHVVRTKAQEFEGTITDVNQKTRAQAARVDDMVSSVLDTTAGIASTLQKGVQIPVREFSGLMHGLKAGLDTLVRGKGSAARGTTRPRGNGYGSDDFGV
jgi:methyl-accepting chemotaxis protein